MTSWINTLLQGAMLGGLYALYAAGLSLIFGIMRLVNLAHGDLIVVAAYVILGMMTVLGLDPFVSALFAAPILFALGYALQHLLLNRTLGRDILPPLLVTFGLSIIFQNGLLQLLSADTRHLQAGALEIASIHIGGIAIGAIQFITFASAILVILVLNFIFYRTCVGRAFRATSDDPEIAQLMGIDNRHIFSLAMAVAMVAITVSALYLGVRSNFDPTIGPARLLYAFEAVIIGGLGSLWGTLAGGIIIGVAQAIGGRTDPEWQILGGHIAFLIVLVLRPEGLFPQNHERRKVQAFQRLAEWSRTPVSGTDGRPFIGPLLRVRDAAAPVLVRMRHATGAIRRQGKVYAARGSQAAEAYRQRVVSSALAVDLPVRTRQIFKSAKDCTARTGALVLQCRDALSRDPRLQSVKRVLDHLHGRRTAMLARLREQETTRKALVLAGRIASRREKAVAGPYRIQVYTPFSRSLAVGGVGVLTALLVLPAFAGRDLLNDLIFILTMLALAQCWNLLAGYAGLVSVGQQAFVGLGGYLLFALTVHSGMDPLAAIIVAGILGGALALPTALVVFRLTGAYFAIGTWVVAEVYRLVFAQFKQLGGGTGTSLPPFVTNQVAGIEWVKVVFGVHTSAARDILGYFAALTLATGTILLVYLILRSRYGLALAAIRDSEVAAEGVGVDNFRVKLWVYVVTAAATSMVGALIYLQKARISPDAAFSVLDWTAYVIFIVVIGGIGTIEGPIVGVLILYLLQANLAHFGTWYLMLLGVLAIIVMLVAPAGIWGYLSARFGMVVFPVRRRLVAATPADPAAAPAAAINT
jgi:branched-chain amino acid transport system permease protein